MEVVHTRVEAQTPKEILGNQQDIARHLAIPTAERSEGWAVELAGKVSAISAMTGLGGKNSLLVFGFHIRVEGNRDPASLVIMGLGIGEDIRVWRAGTTELDLFEIYGKYSSGAGDPFVLKERIYPTQITTRRIEKAYPSIDNFLETCRMDWTPEGAIEKDIKRFIEVCGQELLDPEAEIDTYNIFDERPSSLQDEGNMWRIEVTPPAFPSRPEEKGPADAEVPAGENQASANAVQEKKALLDAAKRSPSQQSMRSVVPSAALGLLVASIVVLALLNRVRIQKMIQTWGGGSPKADLPLPPIEAVSLGEGILS